MVRTARDIAAEPAPSVARPEPRVARARVATQRPLRVLFLSPHYPPDVAATGQLVADLAEDLAAAGHEPIVLAARPALTSGAQRRFGWYERERRDGVEILWLGVPQIGRRGAWSRLVPFVGYFLAAAVRALALRRIDIVFAQSTPPLLAALLGWLVSLWPGRRFVYNVQDVYPDLGVALGVLREGLLLKTTTGVERWLRHRADIVTLVGADVARHYEAKERNPPRVKVIPNWADTHAIAPEPRVRNRFLLRHGLQAHFVVMYAGNFGRAHDVEVLPDIAAQLADLDDLRVVLVGDGPGRPAVAKAVAARGLANVLMLPFQHRHELGATLCAGHVGLVLQRARTAGLVVPSKIYGVMASGCAVVAAVPVGAEAARIVGRAQAGIVTKPGDAAAVAAAIRALYCDRTRLAQYARNARDAAVHHHDRTSATARYQALFAMLSERT